MSRLLPFRNDDGIFDPSFIEDRRKGLEIFVWGLSKIVALSVLCNFTASFLLTSGKVNKVAGHPLAQNEKSLHIFLQEATIDRNYTPGKVRAT